MRKLVYRIICIIPNSVRVIFINAYGCHRERTINTQKNNVESTTEFENMHWNKNTESKLKCMFTSDFGSAIFTKSCLPTVKSIEAKVHSIGKYFLKTRLSFMRSSPLYPNTLCTCDPSIFHILVESLVFYFTR